MKESLRTLFIVVISIVLVFWALFFIVDLARAYSYIPEYIPETMTDKIIYPYTKVDYKRNTSLHDAAPIYMLVEMDKNDLEKQMVFLDNEMPEGMYPYYLEAFSSQLSEFSECEGYRDVINNDFVESYYKKNDDKTYDIYIVLNSGKIAIFRYSI